MILGLDPGLAGDLALLTIPAARWGGMAFLEHITH